MVPGYRDKKNNWKFYNEIKFYTVTISILIFVEHSMSIAAGVYRGRLCTNTTNVEAYFRQAFPQIYLVTEYSGGWKEFLAELLNYYCVFLWSFMDIFIVGVSKCLSTRLNQFNEY
ncbi:Gustatory receptor for sugar taste 64f, partial [Pseudolycoriella hygida]